MQLADGDDGRYCGVTAQGRVAIVRHGRPRECVASLVDAKRVACSRALTCIERTNGGWQCVGDTGLGTQIGVGDPVEIPVADIADLVLGRAHSCARTRGGDVYCWGDNGFGQCGRPTTESRVRAPVRLASGIEGVSLGIDSTWLLRRDGSGLALGRVWFRGPGVTVTEASAMRGFHECDGGCFAPAPARAPFPGAVAKLFDGECATLRSGATGCLDHGRRRAAPSGAGTCDSAWCAGATDPACRIEGRIAKCGNDEITID